MTEIERILSKGIIKEEFLKEETRCDFFVDEKRKKIWAVELDMAIELDKVCKKHNLKYVFADGSLLGAVRHNGFIPWDDDIDVYMPREDYDKLIKIGMTEFSEPYFLQTPYTDDGYFYSFAKLRNSNTSAISKLFRYEEYNQGIFLDIFPIDNCNPDTAELKQEAIRKLILDNSNYMRISNPHLTDEEKLRASQYSGRNPLHNYEEIEAIAQSTSHSEYCTVSVSVISSYEKKLHKWKDYDNIIYVDFENIKVPISAEYDKILKTAFGDYMQFPPVEKRGCDHASVLFDPDIPYKELLKTIR